MATKKKVEKKTEKKVLKTKSKQALETKDKKVLETKKEKTLKTKTKDKKDKLKRFHFSFGRRLIFYSASFLCLFFLSFYFIINSFDLVHEEKISFKETGSIDYSVCLNKNDTFETECLGKNSSYNYVASLINNISVKFNYTFGGNKLYLEKPLKYKIVGKLIIKNKENSYIYSEKEYILKEESSDNILTTGLYYNIDDTINIDYSYYNNIANQFKSEYGVDTDSYLDVSFIVYNEVDAKYNIPNSSNLNIKIPLSLKSIKFEVTELNNNSEQTIIKEYLSISDYVTLIFGILLFIFSIYYLICFIILIFSLKRKKNIYDKMLNKYMKEYDRLIVATKSLPTFSDYNMLKIDSFEELLDVRDNLRLPIMYYNVIPHQKAYFYILHENNLYVYTLKEVDLANEKKNK
jgi:hypothetical protein